MRWQGLASACGVSISVGLLGCAPLPTTEELKKTLEHTRKNPHFSTAAAQRPASGIGVGLSGGGTRAAASSIGFLAGLQEAGLLSYTDVVSSVSGGSYGVYWWYSRFLEEKAEPRTVHADCLPRAYGVLHPNPGDAEGCFAADKKHAAICPKSFSNYCPGGDAFRHQGHLRGFQDVLSPGTFDYRPLSLDGDAGVLNGLKLLAHSVLAMVPNFVANVAFDWQANVSPTRSTYREGIGATYGTPATNCDLIAGPCVDSRPLGPLPPMPMDRLEEAWRLGAPRWVINAHASSPRSGLDFSPMPHPEITAFEFTQSGFGSSVHDFHSLSSLPDRFEVLDAVAASAAFFSMQQKVVGPEMRWLLNTLMLASSVNWGISIDNPQVGDLLRFVHRMLPFPLYYAYGFKADRNSAYIDLADGGLTDNLGAYALFRRNLPVWILSDHSYDRGGIMPPICDLRRRLQVFGRDVRFPGLAMLPLVCDSETDLGYDIFNWRYPILLGCVTLSKEVGCEKTEGSILLVKPALNGHLARDMRHWSDSEGHTATKSAWKAVSEACAKGFDSNCAETAKKHLPCSAVAFEQATPTDKAVKGADWKFDSPLPCEVLGFLLVNGFGRGVTVKDSCPGFPQNSSIVMTANSSYTLYGAYRDLSRWYARQLGYFFDKGVIEQGRFSTVMASQAARPMEPDFVDKDEARRLTAPKAGRADDCLYLNAPSASRSPS